MFLVRSNFARIFEARNIAEIFNFARVFRLGCHDEKIVQGVTGTKKVCPTLVSSISRTHRGIGRKMSLKLYVNR